MKQYNPKDNNEKLEKIFSSLKNEIKNKYLGKKGEYNSNDIKVKIYPKENIKEEEYEHEKNKKIDNFEKKEKEKSSSNLRKKLKSS